MSSPTLNPGTEEARTAEAVETQRYPEEEGTSEQVMQARDEACAEGDPVEDSIEEK